MTSVYASVTNTRPSTRPGKQWYVRLRSRQHAVLLYNLTKADTTNQGVTGGLLWKF